MIVEYTAPDVDVVSFTFENEGGNQDKPIFVDVDNPTRSITSRTARKIVRQLVAGFRTEGLETGDCVCIHAFNDIYYPLLYLGIIGAGGRFTGSNPSYTSYELNHHVRTAHVKYLISEPYMLPTVLITAKECGIPDSRIFVFDPVEHEPYNGLRSWEVLLQHGERPWVTFNDPTDARRVVSTLSFTSGTTGLPKAAMISHHFSVSQIHTLQSLPNKPYQVSRLICLPPFHNFVVPLITGCAIREQHSVYMMRRFDVKRYIDAVGRFSITECPMVPTLMISILMSPLATRKALQSIRYVWVSGSTMRSSTQAAFQALLSPEAKISQAWGMTETGWTTTSFWPIGDNTGGVGKTLPGMRMKLVDAHGNDIDGDDHEGEILVKGPCMMLGYLDNAVATAGAIDADGWLRTGDIGYRRKGYWYIIDRKKDMIKVRGWQVAPAELEAVLLTHPQISAACVVGVPLPDGTGEVPRAYVIRKPRPEDSAAGPDSANWKSDVGEEEVQAYLASRLAKYKALDGGVRFVGSIPRNATGKALKFKLREAETDGIGKRVI